MQKEGSLHQQADLLLTEVAACQHLEKGWEELLEDLGSLQEAAVKAEDSAVMCMAGDAQALLALQLAEPLNAQTGKQSLYVNFSFEAYTACLYDICFKLASL